MRIDTNQVESHTNRGFIFDHHSASMKLPDLVTMTQLLRQQGWKAYSYGKIYHVGKSDGHFGDCLMDIGKAWDEAEMLIATPAGNVIEERNLTGGKLSWSKTSPINGAAGPNESESFRNHKARNVESHLIS